MANPTIKPSANISILWGSKNAAYGANTNAMPNGMLLETLTITPKNGEPIDIEDGDGITALQVMCKDGFNGKATAVYDANKILPADGDNIVVVAPKQDGNVGTANVNCSFWSWSLTRPKKKETMIELSFTNRPNINT